MPIDWRAARKTVYEAGLANRLSEITIRLSEADGHVLAAPLAPVTDLPAFPTSSVDGYAVRGAGPWRAVGKVLAGQTPPELAEDGTAVEIATGAMVPRGAEAILRTEHSRLERGLIHGTPKSEREWREPGEEARAGETLFPAGTRVSPGLIGLAASCGHDTLSVVRRPRVALLIFGDELLTTGASGAGRVRDSLGPSMPAYLARLGADAVPPDGPIEDSLEAHVAALRSAWDADVICTTGGTMHGPVDHLHSALAAIGAEYVVNTVAVRPGFPMLVASVKHGGRVTFVAGLPGNPQSAVVALMSLVVPLLAGLTGAPEPEPSRIILGGPVPGRGDYTHLALVRDDEPGWVPAAHVGSAMLRGLAGAQGFAIIPPRTEGLPGHPADFLELP